MRSMWRGLPPLRCASRGATLNARRLGSGGPPPPSVVPSPRFAGMCPTSVRQAPRGRSCSRSRSSGFGRRGARGSPSRSAIERAGAQRGTDGQQRGDDVEAPSSLLHQENGERHRRSRLFVVGSAPVDPGSGAGQGIRGRRDQVGQTCRRRVSCTMRPAERRSSRGVGWSTAARMRSSMMSDAALDVRLWSKSSRISMETLA